LEAEVVDDEACGDVRGREARRVADCREERDERFRVARR
jgi:hypothetical protein